ncbi:cytochrome P450 81Q32 [Beta vulgaris subsp. vulgaris]|uniref:cytochrome P450 81Q32 n=1 Tax=Beta vulgaris subsp. vulgaris TaxID=3555 RepID=UPI002036BB94|nr:cytochrome P450 81Q32 [Beta vulgaris subsp. vulgaris]
MHLYYLPIAVVLYMVTFHFLRKLQNRPPRPFLCLPLIGHFWLLTFPLAECLAKLAERYGPVVYLEFGWMPSLSVCSASAAEECLSKNDVAFCNRPHRILIGKYAGNNFTSINFSPYGPHWRNLRRIAAVELLSSHRLQSLSGIYIRADEVRLLVQRLYRKVIAGSDTESKSKVVDMRPELFDLAMSVMTRLIFGKRYQGLQAKKLEKMVETFFGFANVVHIGDFIPYLRWLDWGKERRLQKFKQDRDALMRDLIEEYIREIKVKDCHSENNDDSTVKVKPMLQVLLELQQSQPEYYKDEIIFSILLDLLVGGSDSSATTMEWAFSLLLNHPEVLEKAHTEIENHVGHDRLLAESDLKSLPYVQCIIKETLRMYPPNPTLFPHESSKDCIVGGYPIPQGTALDVNIWAIQNDPNIWGDPQNFRPERFDGVEGYRIGFKMMPFGSGRRICPGEGLAIRVLSLAIGSLIQCFDWERIDDQLVDMNKVPDLFMHKIVPLQARVAPRHAILPKCDCT